MVLISYQINSVGLFMGNRAVVKISITFINKIIVFNTIEGRKRL